MTPVGPRAGVDSMERSTPLEFRGPQPGLSMVVRITGGPETPDTCAAAAARSLASQDALTAPVTEVEMSVGKRLRTSL